MKYLTILVLLLFTTSVYSLNKNFPFIKGSKSDTLSNKNNLNKVINIRKAKNPIVLDGLISEPDWESAQKAENFSLVLPVDTGKPKAKSEVVMTYDDKALYLGITFFDTIPGKRIMESYRRDFNFGNNDNVLIFFDTFMDQTNGFSFGASASGAKWDGTMSEGGRINTNWDCKWESKTTHYHDRWVTEMKIPFRSVRFKSGADRWYVNFSRQDLKNNEKSAWAPVPRQFPTASLAYTGVLQWDEPLPKSPIMFSVIPYIYTSASKNFQTATDTKYRNDFGFDAKLGLTTSMNLDLTYNPDFSQAEVDQQVTNLDRFELFFPEKRQFFLENSDLFSNYGTRTITPFFSRRIGLDAPVLAGARLSGKISKDWRLGVLNMQTEKTNDHPARNFLVTSLQRQVFSRSSIGMILVNKEYIDEPGEQNFNRIAGLDYNLANSNNTITGKLFYHRSFGPENPGKQYAQGSWISYNSKRIQTSLVQASVGENYRAEAGFVRRYGYNFLNPEFQFVWIPNKKVVSHGFEIDADYFFDKSYNKIEHDLTIDYDVEFENRMRISAGIRNSYIFLDKDYDPTHISNINLEKGSEYNTNAAFVRFNSDSRKLFNYSGSIHRGEFYTGNIGVFEGSATYRYQPYLNLNFNLTYTDIDLPAPFERSKFLLISPKMDLTLSDKVFFSTFVQYNEQIENMNLNVRFQWRYKPVSDLFIVYTDNYYTDNWTSRNRALVLKLTYWLN